MANITIKVTVEQDGKKFVETQTFLVSDLRSTPNPRQAMVAHFLYMAREVLTNVRPHFTL